MSFLDSCFSLKNKLSVVTGGADGNGKSICEALLRAGSTVVAVDFDEEKLRDTIDKFRLDGLDAYLFVADITKSKNLDNLVKFVISVHNRVDVLVNNAGITLPNEFLSYPDEFWQKTYEVNLKAPYMLSKEFGKIMKEQGSGSIINITSLNAELAFNDNPAYVTFKGALKQLTKSIALDLGKYGIRANNIGPGYFRTKMTQSSWSDKVRRKKISEKTILGRWGRPDDLQGLVIFLASDSSSYITGQDIYVDGGWLIKGI